MAPAPKSSAAGVNAFAAAGLEAWLTWPAGVDLGTGLAGLAAPAAGTRITLWQAGHLTALPAISSRTLTAFPQVHFNWIGMAKVSDFEGKENAENRDPWELQSAPH
jgi:hypothetical protein